MCAGCRGASTMCCRTRWRRRPTVVVEARTSSFSRRRSLISVALKIVCLMRRMAPFTISPLPVTGQPTLVIPAVMQLSGVQQARPRWGRCHSTGLAAAANHGFPSTTVLCRYQCPIKNAVPAFLCPPAVISNRNLLTPCHHCNNTTLTITILLQMAPSSTQHLQIYHH